MLKFRRGVQGPDHQYYLCNYLVYNKILFYIFKSSLRGVFFDFTGASE
jgi:hypothetical protein